MTHYRSMYYDNRAAALAHGKRRQRNARRLFFLLLPLAIISGFRAAQIMLGLIAGELP